MAGLGLRELGATGMRVTSLAFGASPLGNVFGTVKEADAIASVHEAARLGINYFDVSPYYGDTLEETVLEKALKTMPVPRESYLVSTKCGRYASGFDFTADRVTRSVNDSLARLNLNHIDIILCHDIEFASLDQIVQETLPALQTLKDAGKVRHIGVSGLPLNIFRHVVDRSPKGAVEMILSYCHYSLNDTSLLELVPYLQDQGVGIISASPLSMGLLSGQACLEWHPAPPEVRATCARAAEVCKAHGKSLAKLAVQFAVWNRSIATTLVGMSSVDVVRENVETVISAVVTSMERFCSKLRKSCSR